MGEVHLCQVNNSVIASTIVKMIVKTLKKEKRLRTVRIKKKVEEAIEILKKVGVLKYNKFFQDYVLDIGVKKTHIIPQPLLILIYYDCSALRNMIVISGEEDELYVIKKELVEYNLAWK